MNNYSKIIKNDFYLIVAILVYLGFILTWYYKPPWLIDHLIYVHIANAQNELDLSFWNFHREKLPVGHHNERWGILVPIIIFNKLFFFLTPGAASQVLIISVHLGIMISIYVILINYNDRITANIFLILWLFASHHTKNRATEILAEPFCILYVCLSILGFIFFEKKNDKFYLFAAIFFLVLIPLTKIHLGIFSLILLIVYFNTIRNNFKDLIFFTLISIFILNVVLLFNYGITNYLVLIKNSFSVYLVYFGVGLPVGNGIEGKVIRWLNQMISEKTLMPIFFVSAIYMLSKKINKEAIFAWLSIIFLILIFILTSILNFPPNQSYAKPLHFFTIPCLAVFISYFFTKRDKKNVNYFLVLISTIIPLILIYYLGKYQKNQLLDSTYAITIVITLVFSFFLIARKERVLCFYLLLIICSSNFFLNNWKLLSGHYNWRNGYSEHYKFLNGSAKLLNKLDDEKVLVYFSSWPINKKLLKRERMYSEPGIRSMLRNDVDITSAINNDKIHLNKYDFILTDVDDLNLEKLEEISISSRKAGILHLYKVQ
ncbi:hypothetical protein OAS53_00400 [Candidatus Pelagibacter ubique]|nr:hypothetical protein [Candidatus Pelagibacter ubique]